MSKKTILTILSALIISFTPNTLNAKRIKTRTNTTEVVKTSHKMKGNASYYGSHYTSKRKTASGEYFNKNAYTAAHRTLPFGTKVKVTNTTNGKSVIVKINDRGPYGKGRVIDLSVIAARDLGMIKSGIAQVTMEIIK